MTARTEPEGDTPVGLDEHARGDRVFDFDPGVDLSQAVRVIRAALEDEGLTLAPEFSHGRITSVTVDGRCLVRVPAFRIVDPEQDSEIRQMIERGLQAQLDQLREGAR